jgi:chromosome partitioning protein
MAKAKRRTYAVALLKGGAGKTTTAVMLAEAAAEAGSPTLLVDADAQATASALAWNELAVELDERLRADVVAIPTRDLNRRISTVSKAFERVVIDTPPAHPDVVTAAMEAADVVVVPTLAAVMDLQRAQATALAAQELGKPAVVVLVRTRPVKATETAREALEEAGFAVATTEIPQREALAAAYGLRPRGMPLGLYQTLYAEIEEALS